uniref:Uncharacterized protein n=1 Tax=viral metagenome TaxID=1070528 RepID=A0A6M3L1X3_9ZZZZ
MAKVTAPLLSMDASGAIGDAMVHFNWKGKHVVRNWLKPTNPQTIHQKIVRQKMAAMGKNSVKIETPKATLLAGSKMYQMLKAATPAGQIWNAHFGKQTMDHVKDDANMVALSSALFGCASTVGVWRENATTLGMEVLAGDQYATNISPELQLYMGGYAAYKLALSSYTSKYDTHPCNWPVEAISNFATDYHTVKA